MLLNDLRYAARVLRKSPLVTLAIIFTVALAIGASTVIFSFVYAVMLKPLPFDQPDRLVWIALPLSTVRTMDEWLSNTAAQPRLNAILLVIFAGLAMLIAAIGIYSVLAYSVNQRTREIGLRMVLGAPRAQALRMVVREGMVVGAIGVAAGVGVALAVSRILSSLVYDVQVRDPLTYLVVAVSLALVALVACIIPARKASRVDPMVALRYDM